MTLIPIEELKKHLVSILIASIKRFILTINGISTKHLPNYLNWRIWLMKTVEMIQAKRSTDLFDESAKHRYSITKSQNYAKNPLPVVA